MKRTTNLSLVFLLSIPILLPAPATAAAPFEPVENTPVCTTAGRYTEGSAEICGLLYMYCWYGKGGDPESRFSLLAETIDAHRPTWVTCEGGLTVTLTHRGGPFARYAQSSLFATDVEGYHTRQWSECTYPAYGNCATQHGSPFSVTQLFEEGRPHLETLHICLPLQIWNVELTKAHTAWAARAGGLPLVEGAVPVVDENVCL